jgi:hypothetical protein
MSWLKRYPLVSFFILAFGLAWILMIFDAVSGRSFTNTIGQARGEHFSREAGYSGAENC